MIPLEELVKWKEANDKKEWDLVNNTKKKIKREGHKILNGKNKLINNKHYQRREWRIEFKPQRRQLG